MKMRMKKPFLIAIFLCTWSLVSYYLLIRQTDTRQGSANASTEQRRNRAKLLEKLDRLESNIEEENVVHDQLVKKLIEVVRLKGGTNADSNDNNHKNDKQKEKYTVVKEQAVENPVDGNHIDNTIEKANEADINNLVTHIIDKNFDNNKHRKVINSQIESVVVPAVAPAIDSETELHNRLKALNQRPNNAEFSGPIIAVLVIACNRISVRKCLDDLIKYRKNPHQFPIIVSQDCNDETTKNVIESYTDVTLMRQPDQSDIFVLPKDKKFKGYYKISRHYGWALNTTFKAGFENVIIVEDDLNVAPDFYEYFLGTQQLLKNDSTLWCVSAWNDNGKASNIDINSPALLYRTDFFPGLGWMLNRNLWTELSPKWPKAFWDDWIRDPMQRKDRACIRPEVPRTRTFGKIGVSNGMFFEKHLRYIKLNEQPVDFSRMNLTQLLKPNYDKEFVKHVYSCPVVTFEEIRRGLVTTKAPVRIQYNTKDQYKRTAKLLGLMDDFKSGVPRTGYLGIVSFFYNNQRVYLAPNTNWKGYDLTWS